MRRRDFVATALGTAALLPTRALFAQSLPSKTSPVPGLSARTLAGGSTTLSQSDLANLAASLRGKLLMPADEGYDKARQIWNGAFDKRPALLVRCAGSSDIVRAVEFARENQLLTAVRAGGHSSSGKSTCDGGIVIDLSQMQSVRVDPRARTARVEPGVLLGQLDHESAAFGLVTTAGSMSRTGAAGLTLGGGLGRVARRFGLTCDNLLSADVITADGRFIRASERENPDLLWGLRGGGGNFGVVSSFEYQLHEMNPTILGGLIEWPLEQAREVLRFYADFSVNAPDALVLDLNLLWPPNAEPFIQIDACWCADHKEGARVLQPLRRLGKPLHDGIGPMPYVKLQTSMDAFFPDGVRRYIKSGFTRELSPEAIDTILEVFRSMPRKLAIIFAQSGGAVARVAAAATAFPNRDSLFWMIAITDWSDPSEADERTAAIRSAWKVLEPLTYGYYVNAITAEEESRERMVYGANYVRMVTLKNRYDPTNLFRLNTNVKPSV